LGEIQCCHAAHGCTRRSPWNSNSNAHCISGSNDAVKYTFQEAVNQCEELGAGWSLCTRTQVDANICQAKGCGHDNHLVWVRDPPTACSLQGLTFGGQTMTDYICSRSEFSAIAFTNNCATWGLATRRSTQQQANADAIDWCDGGGLGVDGGRHGCTVHHTRQDLLCKRCFHQISNTNCFNYGRITKHGYRGNDVTLEQCQMLCQNEVECVKINYYKSGVCTDCGVPSRCYLLPADDSCTWLSANSVDTYEKMDCDTLG